MLEPKQISMMELFGECIKRLTIFSIKAPSTGLYISLQKYWNFQSEAKVEQIITIVTTRSFAEIYEIYVLSAQLAWTRLTLRNHLNHFMVIMKYWRECSTKVCLFHCHNLLQSFKNLYKSVSLRKKNLKFCTATSTKGRTKYQHKFGYLSLWTWKIFLTGHCHSKRQKKYRVNIQHK